MKMIIAAAMAATAIAAISAPAMAQPYGPPPPPHGDWHGPGPGPGPGGPMRSEAFPLDQRIDWMQTRISRGLGDGSLDRREAFRAQRQLNSIKSDLRHDRYRGHGQLSDYDRQALEGRLDRLNDQLHWMRQNDDRRPW